MTVFNLGGRLNRAFIMAVSLLFIAACSGSNSNNNRPAAAAEVDSGDTGGSSQTITEIAAADDDFETLVAALQAAGLDSTLDDETAVFTVFAPTDEAFDALGEEAINALLADIETLTDILLYHVIAGQAVDAETAISLAPGLVEMANGDEAALRLEGDALFINDAQVIITDIEASNGIIHVIDAVLIPPEDVEAESRSIPEVAIAAGDFTTLVAALQATGLDEVLADTDAEFTVFAPTDEAFAELGDDVIAALLGDIDTLTDILLYHVIAGAAVDSTTAISLAGTSVEMANGDPAEITLVDGNLFIDGSQVIITDIPAANGIIHVIDTVMSPPMDMDPEAGTIPEVAVAAGNFTTLVAALQATGLDATLADESATFTVFAPTDEAFAALGDDVIAALLGDTDTLSDILLYHVIAGSAVDSDTAIALAGTSVQMANGDLAAITLTDGNLFIDGSQVIITDIAASNGVIHVIDTVMSPPEDVTSNLVEVLVADGNFTTLVAALQATGLDTVLADESSVFTVF
nr:fasciclin domain-containing protein [Halieaceae bacterium]